MTEHTVAVIRESDALAEAYGMGFDRFDPIPEGVETPPDSVGEGLAQFKESATFANNVLPSLRALSGFVDSGPGTYTVERDVVVIPEGNAGDLPADGKRMSADWVHDAICDAFDRGAMDAMADRERGDAAGELTIT